MRPAPDERGLVGKLVMLFLVLALLVVVLIVDAGAIVLARLRTSDLAQDASIAAAEAFAGSGERRPAIRAALAVVADDEDARLRDLTISPEGAVTVVVIDHAATLIAGRIGFLEDLTVVTASETSSPEG